MGKGRPWTGDEDEFLANNWHEKGLAYCVKKLNRSDSSVFVRASILGLGGCVYGSGYLTGHDVARVTGISKHIVWDWLNTGLIKHKFAPIKQKIFLVKVGDLEEFLKNNQDLWDSRNLKVSIWRNKPDWFKEKIQKDRLRPPVKIGNRKKWSKQTEQLLLDMAASGKYTYKQMWVLLGKHPKAVESKLGRMCGTKRR